MATNIITRNKQKKQNTWDLTLIYKTDTAFEKDYIRAEELYPQYAEFKSSIKNSAEGLLACLRFDEQVELLLEKLHSYAFLRFSQDLTDDFSQQLVGRVQNLAARIAEASSFVVPTILAIPTKKLRSFIDDPALKTHAFMLEKLLRQKKHVLSQKEERLLALQAETTGSASAIFRQLTDADFKFGTVKDKKETVEVTSGSWGLILENPNRNIRKKAFEKMFGKFNDYSNTLGATYNAQIQQNVAHARIRNYSSAREASLFKDNVPASVYDNLIEAVRDNIELNHRYLKLHKKVCKLKKQAFFDTYLPIVDSVKWNMTYAKAVDTICDALHPLGKSYCSQLKAGLTKKRWVDRYENQGKRSGAFSAGGYEVPPFILMNYNDESISGVYTLAHEGGHSMHTRLAARTQPFVNYDYSIFVAEVASTFNEQLLTQHLLETAKDPGMIAYITDREINQIRATMIRQTMFAEFEKISHAIVENREPLTVERLKNEYGALLEFYMGDSVVIDDLLKMEWARIPHFYSAFYVYKYATGLASSITLAQKVLEDPRKNRPAYLKFLKAGNSNFPLDILADAGADLSTPAPVNTAMKRLETLLDKLETLL